MGSILSISTEQIAKNSVIQTLNALSVAVDGASSIAGANVSTVAFTQLITAIDVSHKLRFNSITNRFHRNRKWMQMKTT